MFLTQFQVIGKPVDILVKIKLLHMAKTQFFENVLLVSNNDEAGMK